MRALGVDVAIERVSADELRRRWPASAPGAERVGETATGAGVTALTIDRHPDGGFLLDTTEFGTHRVAPDGRTVLAAPPGGPEWRWQRVLFAQVLPLAAALQGRTLLHAGAVAVDGRALAIVGAAGAGKSTLAAALLDAGAAFVTDDVLALERGAGGVVVHPGPPFATLPAEQHDALGATARAALGPVVADDEKRVLAPAVPDLPLPLGGVVVLDRGARGGVRLTPVDRPAPLLLAASFVPYVDAPEVLAGALDVCADVAASVRVNRLAVAATSPSEAAAAARGVLA